jgi:drug/metabolite transporter (DMT)-like permease
MLMFNNRILLFACAFVWAIVVPLMSHLLTKYDPVLLSVARNTLGAAVLVALVVWLEPGALTRSRVHPRSLFWLGASLAAFSLLFVTGVAAVDIITAATLLGCQPVVAALLATALGDRQITLALWAATLAASAGALMVAWSPGAFDASGYQGGVILIGASLLAWAWYSIMAQRWLAGRSQLHITAVTFTASAAIQIVVLLSAGWAKLISLPPMPDGRDIALLGGVVLAGVVIGPWLWNVGVRRAGVVLASVYMNLVPIFGIAIATAIGSHPTWPQLAGASLIVVGVAWAPPLPDPTGQKAARTARAKSLQSIGS